MTAINYEWFKDKPCKECGLNFKPCSSVHVFCSPECKGKHPYSTGRITTDGQYEKVSGDWYRYLRLLTYRKGREDLTVGLLLDILKRQNYKCAISGEELTCKLKRGMTFFTNASIDRIIPGGPYSVDNIRLVCRIVNIMKWNMKDEELCAWCKKILINYGS